MTQFEDVLETILEEYARRDSEGEFDTWEETDAFVKEKAEVLLAYVKEEPVSEELEEAVNAYIGYAPEVDESSFTYGKKQAFKAGTMWQKEQFEKNRLAAYERQTKKEADIECNFVMGIIEKEYRQPTFNDAIKYGMTLQKKQMKEALRTEYEKGRHDALEEMKKSKQCWTKKQ